jgi:hypothetical protein
MNSHIIFTVLFGVYEPERTIASEFPIFDDILKRYQYNELDTSLKAPLPSVYAVQQAIIDNEFNLLGKFYQYIKSISSMYDDLLQIPVVTGE